MSGKSEEQKQLQGFISIEYDIITNLKMLEKIENELGPRSHEYIEQCDSLRNLLFLEAVEYEYILNNKNCFEYLIKVIRNRKVLGVEEGILAMSFKMENCIFYRINQIVHSKFPPDGFSDYILKTHFNLDEIIYTRFLSGAEDSSLKYKFAFINYRFCEELVQENFNVDCLVPGVEKVFLETDTLYATLCEQYLSKKFADILYFATNNNVNIDFYIEFLAAFKGLIKADAIENIKVELTRSVSNPQKLIDICGQLNKKDRGQI